MKLVVMLNILNGIDTWLAVCMLAPGILTACTSHLDFPCVWVPPTAKSLTLSKSGAGL